MKKYKDIMTTGEVAKAFKVSQRIVAVWCDMGKLPYYRIPFAKDRRILKTTVLKMLKEHGVPVPPELLPEWYVYEFTNEYALGAAMLNEPNVVLFRGLPVNELARIARTIHPTTLVAMVGDDVQGEIPGIDHLVTNEHQLTALLASLEAGYKK